MIRFTSNTDGEFKEPVEVNSEIKRSFLSIGAYAPTAAQRAKRKGAKKARYMAETAKGDEHAGAVGKALKKLQDEIGDWHDWLVLAEEAHRALGDHGVELVAHIKHARDKHYALALKTAERIRGRLMGEWQATRLRTIRRTRRV